jgi:hypothetical protein
LLLATLIKASDYLQETYDKILTTALAMIFFYRYHGEQHFIFSTSTFRGLSIMNYTKTVFWIILFSPIFIEPAHISLTWMRPTSMLAAIVKIANVRQGSDRLIKNNTFNNKAIFAQLNGHVLPFLPESIDTFAVRCAERQELPQKKKGILNEINGLNRWKIRCATATFILPVLGMYFSGNELFCALPLVGIPYCLHLDSYAHNYQEALNHLSRRLDEWDQENTDVHFAPSDKIMLMQSRTSEATQKALESDAVTWYCPHGDWTKLVGPGSVNAKQVLVPCGSADPEAFPVVSLFRDILDAQS